MFIKLKNKKQQSRMVYENNKCEKLVLFSPKLNPLYRSTKRESEIPTHVNGEITFLASRV